MITPAAKSAFQNFFSALSFITIVPLPGKARFKPGSMIPYFPVAGLFLGFLTAGFDTIACHLWSPWAAGVLDVVFLAVLTGGFHMDGLADTADGVLAHHDKERALLIMKDSRVGAMGLLAVVLCIAVKMAGMAQLGPFRPLLILLIPAYARGMMLFGFLFLPYGRKTGTGHAFFENTASIAPFAGLAPAVLLSLFLGIRFALLNLAFLLIAGTLVWFYKKRLGVITGDMLGAMVEMGEALLFLLLSARCLP